MVKDENLDNPDIDQEIEQPKQEKKVELKKTQEHNTAEISAEKDEYDDLILEEDRTKGSITSSVYW